MEEADLEHRLGTQAWKYYYYVTIITVQFNLTKHYVAVYSERTNKASKQLHRFQLKFTKLT